MTEHEIEVVAEELAKVGGTTWHPGREHGGPLLRAVSERYRDRARVAIAALDRLRAKEETAAPQESTSEGLGPSAHPGAVSGDGLEPGAIVVYRPPGDQRAISCKVERIKQGRAYLVPCTLPDVGWVSVDTLLPLTLKNTTEAD